jgi:hypothetical protein
MGDTMKDTVTIPGMPGIWSSNILFLANSVAGSFAKWAVRQSPFVVPDNLAKAIEAVDCFVNSWTEGRIANGEYVVKMSCEEVRSRLERFFEDTPVIEAWNHPKSGKEQPFYGCDRYGSWQSPEDDIIDLGALAQNIAHDLTLSDVFDRAHD